MVAAIDSICDARDEIRCVFEAITRSTRALDDREEIVLDREKAITGAAEDMKAFINRIYGPDSELTKISEKLGAIESAAGARDSRYMRQFQDISDRLNERFDLIESRVRQIEERVLGLEKLA
jgi:hypothetical protein